MKNDKLKRYNDGVIFIYREKERKTDFNAKKNVSAMSDMDLIVKLDFGESSRREEDNEFAQQMGFSLSLKVRTRFFKNVDNKCKAVVDGYLYDVKYVDKNRSEMWLYLEGIRELKK